jgi:hypothetical protein
MIDFQRVAGQHGPFPTLSMLLLHLLDDFAHLEFGAAEFILAEGDQLGCAFYFSGQHVNRHCFVFDFAGDLLEFYIGRFICCKWVHCFLFSLLRLFDVGVLEHDGQFFAFLDFVRVRYDLVSFFHQCKSSFQRLFRRCHLDHGHKMPEVAALVFQELVPEGADVGYQLVQFV